MRKDRVLGNTVAGNTVAGNTVAGNFGKVELRR
jgi:hypothetical protein